ncbi:hypothetical protein [Sphingobium chlorophenolicum]|uniref:Uncharacterized protein n=1 Tax=Sphingobium chlorophenolicum TaxID=46429 RepID=A0A081RAC4_SPHCR|nr:hypothetical protein [Sphingobium chlorophenolicum]KEQ52147.1 hypothetical protein BV95_03564 [Sphingobium chlorophenolicum]
MQTNYRLGRASYAIITAIAALVAATGGDEGYGWPFILGHFLVAWIVIAAFAHLGKILYRRP